MLRRLWYLLIRFGFRLLYNEMAFTYEWVAYIVSLGAWWDWGRTALDFLPPPEAGQILELAHGTGRLQVALNRDGWRTTGFDLSRSMGRLARKRLARERVTSPLVRGRAQRLPFKSGTFAAVVSTFPTAFIIEDDTLTEVFRVLQSRGRLVFVPTGVLARGGITEAAIEGAFRITGQRAGWDVDWREQLDSHGFRVETHTVNLEESVVYVVVAERIS